MTSPWTEPEGPTGGPTGLSRGQWIGLGTLLAAGLAFAGYAFFWPQPTTKLSADVILGDWQATDPPWTLSFRPDKTVELTYEGSAGPQTLAPTVATPGVPVAGKFLRSETGVYRLKLDNGKVYEAAIGKYKIRKDDKLVDQYIENRLDLTDADESSGVVVFQRVRRPPSSPQAVPGTEQ
jgi:hypothetical protein